MKTEILMPSLSPTMEEGSLAKWYVSPGDKIKPGDIIADIETDKALMEYESIEEGTIVELIVKEGTENIKVNALIAVMETEGADETIEYKQEVGRVTKMITDEHGATRAGQMSSYINNHRGGRHAVHDHKCEV